MNLFKDGYVVGMKSPSQIEGLFYCRHLVSHGTEEDRVQYTDENFFLHALDT
ncbi:hypothetical protein JOD43_003473 [Pullulanibacillus pueri]|nr:hypothetical protein [Pullulanibacillus pueri]